MPLKITGIDEANHRIRPRRVRAFALQHRARDFFIRLFCIETVRARQINQAKFIAVPIATGAFLFLNRDARIIRNLLAQTRECVEERGLAGIRIADEGKQTGVCHGRKFTG